MTDLRTTSEGSGLRMSSCHHEALGVHGISLGCFSALTWVLNSQPTEQGLT